MTTGQRSRWSPGCRREIATGSGGRSVGASPVALERRWPVAIGRRRGGSCRYPATSPVRRAQGALAVADARAAERAEARRVAREQKLAARRERARQRRLAEEQAQAEQQAEDQQSDDSAAPSAPSGTCAEIGRTDIPVPPGDPRDADGDGLACES